MPQVDEKEIRALREHYERSMELAQSWGLKPFETDFHIVPADKIYEIASYGIPGHFSHWTYGRDFWIQKQRHDYGHARIYELVINSDPAQAFLLDSNSALENMFVISHVIGHSDFFANNVYFANTNRSIEHTATAVADRFREYELEHGRYEVESFIDDVMTIRYHINKNPRIKERSSDYELAFATDPYEDLFPEVREIQEAQRRTLKTIQKRIIPAEPTADLVGFIAQYGRLTDWQRDVMQSIREETEYFWPQILTKIANEGWASLIHRCMMHHLDPEVDPGGVEFSLLHSGVLSGHPGVINPYWLGFNLLWRTIQKFGEHTDEEMRNFEFINGPGWEKVLEIRAMESDVTFVRNYLDKEVCEKLDLFAAGFIDESKEWVITDKDWEDVRDALVTKVGDNGIPVIEVWDGDYDLTGQLLLVHQFDGRDLDKKYLDGTLRAITRLWGKPARLHTQDKAYISDGVNVKEVE